MTAGLPAQCKSVLDSNRAGRPASSALKGTGPRPLRKAARAKARKIGRGHEVMPSRGRNHPRRTHVACASSAERAQGKAPDFREAAG